jgi:hypothetical protein
MATARQFFFHDVSLADQGYLNSKLLCGQQGTLDNHSRGVVTPHGIQSNLDHWRRP